MKIAIPVDENKSEVFPSLGRTPCFIIFDNETGKKVFLNNSAVSGQGGAGVKAAQLIVDEGVNVVLTERCGENAAEVLKAGDIRIYKINNYSIDDNIQSFLKGELKPLGEIHKGVHHGGSIL
ncbi:NifB/NifX family molybdenum-iron cluster-binding protein [Clostridium polynesiense]|uniref:NifB/NifX family molybdenum-iron cluster-binding protein n=1 Tax=Clostridium polynesiense TaxID=1325933 RepID=UPI00058E54CB|nr:NifB/NifX family molybdenum-iron cluster-binding protein [Clostridium polynesiense]